MKVTKSYFAIEDFFSIPKGRTQASDKHAAEVAYFGVKSLSACDVTTGRFTQLANDSRNVSQDCVFIAQQGGQAHGLDYLQQVLQSGCRLLISDRPVTTDERVLLSKFCQLGEEVVMIYVPNLNQVLAGFCHWFYDQPSKKLKLIGVTGTNGKTSTAFYCAQMIECLQSAKHSQTVVQKVAMIGTLGNGPLNDLSPSVNTTPDIVRLTRLFAKFVEQKVVWVVMEVSSHAIALQRVAGVSFYVTAITQIGSDHLDFHGTQKSYEQTKLQLFTDYPAKYQVLNLQDPVVRSFVEQRNHGAGRLQALNSSSIDGIETQRCFYGDTQSVESLLTTLHNEHFRDQALMYACPTYDAKGVGFDLFEWPMGVSHDDQQVTKMASEAGAQKVVSSLFGQFNIENLMCTLAIMRCLGFSIADFKPHTPKLTAVPGRMQVIHRRPTVILDFAHTADGLQNLLQAVAQHHVDTNITDPLAKSKTWLVFGCGGDRDRLKRPLMAKVAEHYAQQVMLTSDNPRFEAPEQIIADIVPGFSSPKIPAIQVDRKKAIFQVLENAAEQDVVVIAGKGHETYQDIQGQKVPFSDQSVVNEFYDVNCVVNPKNL